MGLIARALEINGIATTVTCNRPGMIRPMMPPRVLLTKFDIGSTLGKPQDGVTQMRVLKDTLSLLGQDTPIDYLKFVE